MTDGHEAASRRDKVELYRAIGEFIHVLSLLEFSIRRALGAVSALGPAIDLVTAPYGLADLCLVGRNVFSARSPPSPETARTIGILDRARALNDIRKPMVHGTWIQRGEEYVPPGSLGAEAYFASPSALQAGIAEARDLLRAMDAFHLSVANPGPSSFRGPPNAVTGSL